MVKEIVVACDRAYVSTEFKACPLDELFGFCLVEIVVINFGLASLVVGIPFPLPCIPYNSEDGVFDVGFRLWDGQRIRKTRAFFGQGISSLISFCANVCFCPDKFYVIGRDGVDHDNCLKCKFRSDKV